MNLNNQLALRDLSALVDFSNLINSGLDINFILNNLVLTCFGKLHTTKAFIVLKNETGFLESRLVKGFNKDLADNFPFIKANDLNQSTEINRFIETYKIPVCRNLEIANGLIGLLFLGDKITKADYFDDDIRFLDTLCGIAAVSIENSMTFDKLNIANKGLDYKVNQLSSIFDLGKEFSGILDIPRVNKLLALTIIGQLLVSKYAVINFTESGIEITETKFSYETIYNEISKGTYFNLTVPLKKEEIDFGLVQTGVELIIPMNIKDRTKGLILLGKRFNNTEYTKSDIEYISSVSSFAIIAIENGRLFKETLEKQRYEKDWEIAGNIQQNLLPKSTPSTLHFEISAYNKSARIVGGDYYDLVKLDAKRNLVAIADVSGKGVQAALLMANVQAFLKAICKQNISLNEASNLINDLISENTTNGSFITFFWGVLDDETMEFEYVNAGHNPPLLVRNGELTKLKKGGMILGVMETIIPYESEKIKLEKDDVLVLFTDGISEAMDINLTEYSDERLEEFVKANSCNSAKKLMDAIIDDVRKYTINAEQSDDITLLIIKVV